MHQKHNAHTFTVGLLAGAGVAAVVATQFIKERSGCEPVVDVQYRHIGKQSFPETVIRRPVRDGDRCVLAEAGS